jgi:hypothetical protein
VLVIGCGKKKSDPTGGSDSNAPAPGPAPGPVDLSASYTIKVREPQKGDKLVVVEWVKDTVTFALDGKGETKTKEESFEYTETILEMPAGARKPTKSTRAYKVAKATDPTGAMKDLPYAGKTVLIELVGGKFAYSVNGKTLSEKDAERLAKEFRKSEKSNKSEIPILLPKTAVKLNETWTVDRAGLAEMAAADGVTPDLDASSITGKLTKVHTKDGKQWGTIEYTMKMAAKDLGPEAPPLAGTLTGTLTIDSPIDGSSSESRAASKIASDFKGKVPKGALTVKGDDERTQTVTLAK